MPRRTHAEKGFGGEHEGPQVKRAIGIARYPVPVFCDKLADRFEEQLFGQFGHRHAPRTVVETAGVLFGPEQGEAVVGLLVRLHAFEDFLRVMQHGRRGIEADRVPRAEYRLMPATAIRIVIDHDHVIGEQFAEAGVLQGLLAGLAGDRGGVGKVLEIHARRVMRQRAEGKYGCHK